MPVQDRTTEFFACTDSIRSRTSGPGKSEARQRLLQNGKIAQKSELSQMALAIGKDINSTNIKLGKLAQREHHSQRCYIGSLIAASVAKRKTLFDDRPVEISVCHLAPSKPCLTS